MNQPEVLRQSGPHRVEVSEGSKNAQRRQAQERNALPPTQHLYQGDEWVPEPSAHEYKSMTQIPAAVVDTSEVWHGEDVLSERLAQLQRFNQKLKSRLQSKSLTGANEDTYE